MERDERIDAYIAGAAPFARPIIAHLRELSHEAVPGLAETLKWGMPFLTLKGKNLCGIGAFKKHCAFVIEGAEKPAGEGMGNLGKITSLADLPPDAALRELLASRAEALRAGKPTPAKQRKPKPEIPMQDDLAAALSPTARAFFDSLAPSYRRDYLEWITGAKRAETRARRVAEAAEWLADGKKRNWKYEGC
jgi:uncharacterized protein YdeI (YjbR/CyaY-like superfamily)